MSVPHIRVLFSLDWSDLLVYLSHPRTWLLWSRGVEPWLTSVPLAPAHGRTFTTHVLTGLSQVTWGNTQRFLEEPAPPPDFLEGQLWQKEIPIVSIHSEELSHKLFPSLRCSMLDKLFSTGQCEAPRRKTECAFIQIYLPWNLLTKWMFHRTHLEKHCSRHIEFKLSHSALGSTLRI